MVSDNLFRHATPSGLDASVRLDLLLVSLEKQPIMHAILNDTAELNRLRGYCDGQGISQLISPVDSSYEVIAFKQLGPITTGFLYNSITAPDCCAVAYANDAQRRKRFQEEVLGSGKSLVDYSCVPYVPCSPECEKTSSRGYEQIVKTEDPTLYALLRLSASAPGMEQKVIEVSDQARKLAENTGRDLKDMARDAGEIGKLIGTKASKLFSQIVGGRKGEKDGDPDDRLP